MSVLTVTDKNWVKKIMHGGEQTHMFVMFETLDCQDCRKYGTTLAKLAKDTNGSP